MTLIILATIFLAGLIYYFFKKRNENKGSPPGPRGVPFFGAIFSLGRYPHKTMDNWHKQYGPIYKTSMVWMKSVTIGDYNMIKEAYNEHVFSGRPDIEAANYMNAGRRGLIMCEGPKWTEQRRFTLRNLRDFGFGKKSMEGLIQEEVTEFVEDLGKCVGQPISLESRFTLAILNSLWLIVAGERFKHDDPKLSEIHRKTSQAYAAILKRPLVIFLPKLNRLFPSLTGWKTFLIETNSLFDLLRSVISTHKNTISEQAEPRDFIDVYLNEIKKCEDPHSSFFGPEGELSLLSVFAGLFAGGTETTSVTLTWAFLYLVTYPEVQRKMHEEIDRVVGKNRRPALSDKINMPYTESTMAEVFRKSSIAPLSVAHRLHSDVQFHGYLLKKGTTVNANLYHIHHDPEIWGPDSYEFHPERFLDVNGCVIKSKLDRLMPFSIGKRVCIGENLARYEFFLFLTGILQRFEVKYVGDGVPNLEANWGATLTPQKFQVTITERF